MGELANTLYTRMLRHEDLIEAVPLEPVHDCVISPNNSRVVTALRDGTVRIWEVETGEAIAILRVRSQLSACVWLRTAHWR